MRVRVCEREGEREAERKRESEHGAESKSACALESERASVRTT